MPEKHQMENIRRIEGVDKDPSKIFNLRNKRLQYDLGQNKSIGDVR